MSGRRVLLISHDPVGVEMAGLGIRYSELAGVLAATGASVTVAHGGRDATTLTSGVETVPFSAHAPGRIKSLIDQADVVVAHPQWPFVMRWLRRCEARVIFDLYDPETLETLELFRGKRRAVRRLMGHATLDRLHSALRTGHHFMCASEAQRDLWLGSLLALRLIDPPAYDRDPSLRDLIDVVPFGLPAAPPELTGPEVQGPRERFQDAVGHDTELVLWNGGIWRWLDAATAIRAVAQLAMRRPSIRLVFMGASTQPAARAATDAARALAADLGVLDRIVVFNDRWVPYAERGAWLKQAACALTAHPDHVETRFAFRTRVLDCFWAGLPVVSTTGDDLAERVARDGLGAIAPAGDAEALATAIERTLDRGRAAYATALAEAAAQFAWPIAAAPLVNWALAPGPVPPRPGDTPGALRPPGGQRAREAAYRLAVRRVLAHRGG
jgi:glycosyltransferase involved in cell wall biosynthesis